MKFTRAVFLFLVCFHFLYLSKAQELQFFDAKQLPVEGVIVSANSLTSGHGQVFITDNKGLANIKTLELPVVINTYLLGYESFIDTIVQTGNKSYRLKSSHVDLEAVTITGNYGRTDKSVFHTEVISREQINARAANNLQDLFTHQLNMRVSNDAVTGSNVSIQGINGENIKILIDGVPVIGRMNNNINLSQLNLNNISRVEVIKGPASVLYGTNALGGVINIITDASSNPPLKTGFNAYYETTGQYNADAFANVHFRKSDISISGGRYFFDGWSEKEIYRDFEWKPKEQIFGNVRLSRNFSRSKLTYQLRLFDEKVIHKSSVINGLPYSAYAFDRDYKTIRLNNELQASHHFNSHHRIEMTAAYSFYRYSRLTYVKDMTELSEVLAAEPSLHDTIEFGAAMARIVYTKEKPDSKVDYQIGVDLNNEYTTGRRIEGHKKSNGDYAAFASVEMKPARGLILKPSMRAAYNTGYTAPIVPSLQALYELRKNVTVRASYSRGFRSPALKEMYLEFVDANHDVFGNEFLKAEDSDHLLASLDWKIKKEKAEITLSPSLFYNHINNKISLVSFNDIYTYRNFYRYITKGGQVSAGIRFNNLEVSAGYAYTGISNSELNDEDYLYSSELSSMVQYKIKKSNTLFAVFLKYNGRQPQYVIDVDDSVKLFNGESYSMIDCSITQPLFGKRLSVSAGVKNILNVTSIANRESAGAHQSADDRVLTGMGRNAFFRIQYQFSR